MKHQFARVVCACACLLPSLEAIIEVEVRELVPTPSKFLRSKFLRTEIIVGLVGVAVGAIYAIDLVRGYRL